MNPPGSVRDGDTSISLSSRRWFDTKSRHVGEAGDSGEPLGEQLSPPGIELALEHDVRAGTFDSEVEAADAREERPDIHATGRVTRCAASLGAA